MRCQYSWVHTIVVVGFAAASGAGPPRPDSRPPAPPDGCPELCVAALRPILQIKPEEPRADDGHVLTLMKLRHASALRRLQLAAARVGEHADAPDKLVPILEDVFKASRELYDDPAAQVPVLEAHAEIARLLEAAVKCRVDEGRESPPRLEDAHYSRLEAELRLARAKVAACRRPRRDGRPGARPPLTGPQ